MKFQFRVHNYLAIEHSVNSQSPADPFRQYFETAKDIAIARYQLAFASPHTGKRTKAVVLDFVTNRTALHGGKAGWAGTLRTTCAAFYSSMVLSVQIDRFRRQKTVTRLHGN